MIKRKAAKSIKPDTEINNHGDKWTIKVTSTFANNNLDFKMGVPTKYETLDGRHVEVKLKLGVNIRIKGKSNTTKRPNNYLGNFYDGRGRHHSRSTTLGWKNLQNCAEAAWKG